MHLCLREISQIWVSRGYINLSNCIKQALLAVLGGSLGPRCRMCCPAEQEGRNKSKCDHNKHAGMQQPRMFSHHERGSEVRESLIQYSGTHQMKAKSKQKLLVWSDCTWRQIPLRHGCKSFVCGFFCDSSLHKYHYPPFQAVLAQSWNF